MDETPAAEASADDSHVEQVLHGGNTSVVVRVGDTVRRHTGRWTPAVHALLAHLTSVRLADAPTVQGIGDQGREILPFVIGEVGSFEPDGGLTVIDWDFCAPGDPMEDLAFTCWSWAPLWSDRAAVGHVFGDGSVEASAVRLGALVGAYDPDPEDRSRLLPAIQTMMEAHAKGLERLAAQGDPAFVKLLESGVADSARRDAAWVGDNEAALSAALRGEHAEQSVT